MKYSVQNKASLITAGVVFSSLLLNLVSGSLVYASNNGSVYTVKSCANVNDNSFTAGESVLGRGSNFEDNEDYSWTITKVDNPGQGTQTASGTFHLNNNVHTFCITLWTANIISGDTHSEFKWEVDDKDGNTLKKIDSDNFFVDSAQTTPTPTPTNTPTPTATPTSTPTVTPTPTTTQTCGCDEEESTPTPTPTTTVAPTTGVTPTDTPTPTQSTAQSTSSSSNSTNSTTTDNTPHDSVQGIQATLSESTMATTGTFTNTVMNLLFAAGMMIVALATLSYAKEKKA